MTTSFRAYPSRSNPASTFRNPYGAYFATPLMSGDQLQIKSNKTFGVT